MMDSFQEIETSALVERCRRGDKDALRGLYTLFYQRMLDTARRYVDDDIARDVVHDSILMALTSLDSLHDDSKIEAWLTRIVRNMALNHIKHERLLQTQPVETIQDTIPDEQPDEPLIPMDVLMAMVKRLPNGYEQVFRLRTLAGLGHDEISRRLGITSSTSRSQYTHARRLLRTMVQHWWMVLLTLFLGTVLFFRFNQNTQSSLNIPNQKTAQKQQSALADSCENTANVQSQCKSVNLRKLQSDEPSVMEVVSMPDTMRLDQANDTTQGQNQQTHEQKPLQLLPLTIKQTQMQRLAIVTPKRQNDSRMSLAMAFSGLPDKYDQSHATTITGIPSLDTTGEPPQPTDFDNWTQYYNFITEEAEINPTEENLSLRRIAGRNALGNPQQSIEERARHDVPFTVSLSINKTINNRWSLGTGLNYSRLHSTFDMGYSRAFISNEQTIHYLGIPFNASYTFVQGNRWMLYGSAGATLDIPVASSRNTYHQLDGQIIYSLPDTLAVPVQWSLNAGVGVQFNITPHVGIFAQPSVNYYFDNETKTIRTKHPWNVTVPVGLRFTW